MGGLIAPYHVSISGVGSGADAALVWMADAAIARSVHYRYGNTTKGLQHML
jgi:hypothetical protein